MTVRPFPLMHPARSVTFHGSAAGRASSPQCLEALMSTSNLPRGPGLFEIARANGERLVTNVRRIAGA